MKFFWILKTFLIFLLCFVLYLLGLQYDQFILLFAILLYLEFRIKKIQNRY